MSSLPTVEALKIRVPGLDDMSLHPSSSGTPVWCLCMVYIHRDRGVAHPSRSIGRIIIRSLGWLIFELISLEGSLLVSLGEEWLSGWSLPSEGLKGPTSKSSKGRTRCVRTLPSGSEVVVHHHLRTGSLDGSFFNGLVAVNHRWSKHIGNDARG